MALYSIVGRYGGHEMKWVGDATGAQLVGPCRPCSSGNGNEST